MTFFGFFKPRQYQNDTVTLVKHVAKDAYPQLFDTPSVTDEDRQHKFEVLSVFMIIALYAHMVTGSKRSAQKAFDSYFHHLEVALREQGMGDVTVSKTMKKFIAAFNGRITRYHDYIERENWDFLFEAFLDNSKIKAKHLPKSFQEAMQKFYAELTPQNGQAKRSSAPVANMKGA